MRLNRTIPVALIVFVIPILVFAVTSGVYFVGDDWSFLRMVQTVDGSQIAGWLVHSFTSFNGSDFYRPLSQNVFFLLCWHWFQLNPAGYHLVTLLVYSLTCVAVFYLLRDILKYDSAAFIGYLIFSLSALHFEELAWICASCEVVATLFVVLAFKSFARRAYLLSMLWYMLAMMSDETSLLLPLAFLVIVILKSIFTSERVELHTRRLWLSLTVEFVIIVVYTVLRVISVGLHPSSPFSPDLALVPSVLWKSLLNSLGFLPVLGNILLKAMSWGEIQVLFATLTIVIFGAFVVVAIYEVVKKPDNGLIVTQGLIFFGTMLLIVLPIGKDYSEYNLSIPLIGLSIAIGALSKYLLKGFNPRWSYGLATGLAIMFTVASLGSIHEYMQVDGVVLGARISSEYAGLASYSDPTVPPTGLTSLSTWAIEQNGNISIEREVLNDVDGFGKSGTFKMTYNAKTNTLSLVK